MHVLVTGGCGYIGSELVPRLQDDPDVSEVVVLDNLADGSPGNLRGAAIGRDDLVFRNGDIREYGVVESAMRDVNAVIHLAAITGAAGTRDHPERTRAVNFHGTENVLKAARKFGVDRVVFASSCNTYGRAETQELDETIAPDPINPYAETKYEAEGLLEQYAEDYGIETTALRLSTNYGYAPGVRFNLVVNTFVFRALTDRPLTVYGDGSNWRPFIHVKDAARAFADVATTPERWPDLVYNVGASDENYRIADVAETIDTVLDRSLEIHYLEEKRPGPSYHVNFDRMVGTGFSLNWSLPEGIRDLATELNGPTRVASGQGLSPRGETSD